jgi:hypothetical protein
MIGRRPLVHGGLAAIVGALIPRTAWAEEAPVPVARQAELLVRVAAYDRNLPARAQGTARALVVVNSADADSRALGASMESALARAGHIGELPIVVSTLAFVSADALAAKCRADHVSILYITSGLDAGIAGLVTSLDGVDVLSVAALPRYVPQGIVLGFDLVSGAPTLLFHLTHARRQNVAMDPKAVQLMQVYR